MSSQTDIPHAIPASSVQSSIPKSTITKRNPKAKKGLGAKKIGGLGGKKVTKADFEKLEKSAEEHDQIQQRLSVSSAASDSSALEKHEGTRSESLRLAYQDLSLKEKENNKKLSKMDENKKEQASRLGMGMGRTDGVSHSLDMVTISQDSPEKSSRRGKYGDDEDTFYDAFSGSRKNRRYKWDDGVDEDTDEDTFDKTDFSYTTSKKSSKDKPPPSYTVTPIADGHRGDSNVFLSANIDEPKSNRQRNVKSSSKPDKSLPDKYKGANAISSEMLFGTGPMHDSGEQRLRNLEGRSAISSDDFSDQPQPQQPRGGHVAGIKDGVREGVRSVAGKLSNMASDIASTLQDRYG